MIPPVQGRLGARRTAFVSWLEGAAMIGDGALFFSDVLGNRIYRLAPGASRADVFREQANYPNGAVIDYEGRLISCEAGDRATPPRLTRTDLRTGTRETLVELVDGRRLMGPNDVRIDRQGRLYFTDGQRPPFLPPLDAARLPSRFRDPMQTTGVYRVDPNGRVVRLLGPDAVSEPNGLSIAADGRHLFVNENDPAPGGRRRLLRFVLTADGRAAERAVLHDFGRGRPGDGMVVDRAGDIVICAGLNRQQGAAITADVPAGVHVFSVDGRPKGFVAIPEDNVTNLVEHPGEPGCFLVTAGRSIYTVRKEDAAPMRRVDG